MLSTVQEASASLQLAQKAAFFQAAAAIHHLQVNYSAALHCHLQRQNTSGVFQYVDHFLASKLTPASRQQFLAAVRKQMVPLIRADADATADLLLRHLPQHQVSVLSSLQGDPKLQFSFLRSMLAHLTALRKQMLGLDRSNTPQQPVAASNSATAPATTTAAAIAAPTSAGGAAPHAAVASDRLTPSSLPLEEQLLSRPEVVDLYIQLLCRFEPQSVLPFLQAHEHYDVRAAIKHCRAYGVADAEAYLHERLGELEAALKLYLADVAHSSDIMEEALLSGRIPLIQTPWGFVGQRPDGEQGAAGKGFGYLNANVTPEALVALTGFLHRTFGWNGDGSTGNVGFKGHTAEPSSPAVAGPGPSSSAAAAAATAGMSAALRRKTSLAAVAAARRTGGGILRSNSRDDALEYLRAVSGRGGEADDPSLLITADSHKAWLSLLSPRMRMRGAGAAGGNMHRPVMPSTPRGRGATAGINSHHQLQQQAFEEVPSEVAAAWHALQKAVAFCKRNSKSASREDDAQDAQTQWFGLLDAYVVRLRRLKVQQQQQQQPQYQGNRVDNVHELIGVAGGVQDTQPVVIPMSPPSMSHLNQANSQADLSVAFLSIALPAVAHSALRDIYSALVDEVISSMTDHVPLLDIVIYVLTQHGQECFGEFRSTLLGLFGTYAYEQNIMGAANRLITKDAFQKIRAAYGLRMCVREAVVGGIRYGVCVVLSMSAVCCCMLCLMQTHYGYVAACTCMWQDMCACGASHGCMSPPAAYD